MSRVQAAPPTRVHAVPLRVVWRWIGSKTAARLGSIAVLPLLWVLVDMLVSRIPGPVPVVESLLDEALSGELLANFAVSLQRLSIGMAVSVALGLVIGLALGSWRSLEVVLSGPVIASLAVPSVIWALLATMWFGFGDIAPVVTVILSATPFISVNVTTGIQSVPRDLSRMSAAFRVPAWRRLRHLLVPAVLGYLFAGTRLALIVGWQGLLLSEWFGAAEGVGFRARYWYDANRLHGTLAWVLLMISFVLVVDRVLVERASRRVFRWRRPVATPADAGQED